MVLQEYCVGKVTKLPRVYAASAALHESPRILLAAVKFFLGQDEASEGDGDEDVDGESAKAVNPSKAEVYNASKKVLCSQMFPNISLASCNVWPVACITRILQQAS